MDIVAALFVEEFDIRPVPGPSTRIDLRGVFFSLAAPQPAPLVVAPHLVVLVRCRADEPGQGILEVVFRRTGEGADAEPLARNAQPFAVEPGKFTYRLVRAELALDDYGTVEAHCRIGQGPSVVVPLTVLPPLPGS